MRLLLICAICATLFGCASQGLRKDAQEGDWQIEGKLGLSHEGQNHKANIRWKSRGQDYELLLFGPFGSGKVSIHRNSKRVELVDGRDRRQAANAEELLYDTTGFYMPVSLLQSWVLGRPALNLPFTALSTKDGRLARFEQAGWVIDYARLASVNNTTLPEKILVSRDDTKLTLIIKRWTLP